MEVFLWMYLRLPILRYVLSLIMRAGCWKLFYVSAQNQEAVFLPYIVKTLDINKRGKYGVAEKKSFYCSPRNGRIVVEKCIGVRFLAITKRATPDIFYSEASFSSSIHLDE